MSEERCNRRSWLEVLGRWHAVGECHGAKTQNFEDEQTTREMLSEILRLCRSADDRLDAQVEAFDRLRDLEGTVPDVVAALGPRAHEVGARLPQEEQRLESMRGRYAATALAPVVGNVEQARQRLDAAQGELTQARSVLHAGRRGEAVVSTRAAEDAVAQASTLLDGIARLETDLLGHRTWLPPIVVTTTNSGGNNITRET